jgi:predicted acyl esterase
VEATVYASSSSTNLELVAQLEDVTPGGQVTDISDGALIGSMRQVDPTKSWVEPDGQTIKPYQPFTGDIPLTPGQVEPFDIKMSTVLYSVPAGDSLRLVVSTQEASGNCSLFTLLSPAKPCNPTDPQKAALTGSTDTVLYGAGNPSVLNVPLVNPYALAATLGCSTSTSSGTVEPMNWNGGVYGPRDPVADTLTCLSNTR